jgi:exopolyphosphatase/guanosine-5'-triphosphate,3'-diphosphate pyrophosphatase
MIQASIDLGTNTCLLLVREFSHNSGRSERILHDESTVVRLGEGVSASGELLEAAMARAEACLTRYVEIASRFGVKPHEMVAVGTAQARDARNAKPFFEHLKDSLGLNFRILSGDEEAKATFLGAKLPFMDPSKMVVMDIGGGSTELVAMPRPDQGILGESLNIGAVKITEKYLHSNPVTDQEFWAAEEAVIRELSRLKAWRKNLAGVIQGEPRFVAVAGTAVTLAMIQAGVTAFKASEIDGVVITRGDAHRMVEELKWRTAEERKAMPGMEPKRADVILAGALIFWRVMEELDFHQAIISTRGLRFGILESL